MTELIQRFEQLVEERMILLNQVQRISARVEELEKEVEGVRLANRILQECDGERRTLDAMEVFFEDEEDADGEL